ncbi:MAG: tetratricopeptide repeat protein [Ignavibacteriae bacterium]|nr:tetratricopeptide repeat protein [Ignavibacteriota bacterium]MCB9216829.1 tetratricopeptide repeat protein [Ignavibacteria bacterium]
MSIRSPIVSTPLSDHQAERAAHEAFAASRRVGYLPRPVYHDRLNRHVLSESSPLLLYAPSGAGKSALLANWVDRFRQSHPEVFTVEHYVGIGGGRDQIGWMRRVVAEIKERYSISGNLPDTPEQLTHSFSEWLWYAHRKPSDAAEPTLLLILDGLNQLPDGGKDISWLPEGMPGGVSLILSTTNLDTREVVEKRSWHLMEVEPLSARERRSVVGQFLRERKVVAEKNVLGKLAEDKTSGNPLLLRIRLEEVGQLPRGVKAEKEINDLLNAESLDEMYSHMLARAEREHGLEKIKELFSYLALAENELLISELERLCNGGENLSALIQRMSFHFTIHNESLRFHHTSLRNASLERYLQAPESVEKTRALLANFFAALPPSRRTASEAAHHFHELARWNDLATFLTHIPIQQVLWNDESRYDYMIHWRAAEQHLDIAGICVRHVESEAKEIGSETESTEALIRTGSILQITGHTSTALKFFTNALTHARETEEPALVAKAYKDCGTINWRLGNQEEAREHFLHGIEKAEESGNQRLWATIMGNLGNLELSRGNYREAIRLQEVNLQEAEKNNDTQEIARIYGNLGSSYLELREFDKAEQCFQKMLVLAETTNNARRTAMALGSMGILYSRQGNTSAALKQYAEQKKIVDRIGDKEQVAIVTGNSAILYLNRGQYKQALKQFQQMEEIGYAIGNPRCIAVACAGMADTFLAQKLPDRAEPYIHQAEIQYKRLENTQGYITMLLRLALVELQRKNYRRALLFSEEGLQLARDTKAQHLVTMMLNHTGQILIHLNQLDAAEHHFREALQLSQKLNNRLEELQSTFGIGRIQRERGNITEAFTCYEKGLDIAEKLKTTTNMEESFCQALYTSIEYSVRRHSNNDKGDWIRQLDRILLFCSQQNISVTTKSILQLFDLWRSNPTPSAKQIGTLLSSIENIEERTDAVHALLLLATSTASPLLPEIQLLAEELSMVAQSRQPV